MKSERVFLHQLKHILLRLDTEEGDLNHNARTAEGDDGDIDEDWSSDSEDLFEDEKFTGGRPESTAKARSEKTLRAAKFRKQLSIIPERGAALGAVDRVVVR